MAEPLLTEPTPGWYYTSSGQAEDFRAKRELYDQQQRMLMMQKLNPLREATLGQIAQISGEPIQDIALPSQMHSFERQTPVSEPSAVPSFRYMPTLQETPQTAMGQLRQPTQAPTMGFQETVGSPLQYNRTDTVTEPNPQAPSDLVQQQLGLAGVHRAGLRRLFGGMGGVNTLNAKASMLEQSMIASGMDPAEARAKAQQYAAMGSDLEAKDLAKTNMQQRTETGLARQQNLDASTTMMPRRQDEIERHNKQTEQTAFDRANWTHQYQQKMAGHQNSGDEVKWANLNERRFQFDKKVALLDAIDKAGLLSDEERQAAQKHLLDSMEGRESNENELGFFERLTGTSKQRYTYKGRPSVGPSKTPANAPSAPGATTTAKGVLTPDEQKELELLRKKHKR